jgi:hypothetical protein
MFESSLRLAVGSEGSKNPCECWRGRCFCSSSGGAKGEPFLATGCSFGMYTADGRLKLGRAGLLLAFVLYWWAVGVKVGSCAPYGEWARLATEREVTELDESLAEDPGRGG